jgi:alpha-mannosidase
MDDETGYRFLDKSGKALPVQVIRQEAAAGAMTRYLLPVTLLAGESEVLEMEAVPEKYAPPKEAEEGNEAGNGVFQVNLGPRGVISSKDVPEISVRVYPDPSDTWSHGIHSYPAEPEMIFQAGGSWLRIEDGPLRYGFFNTLRAGDSVLRWYIYLYRDEPVITMKLRLNFSGSRRIVKMAVTGNGESRERHDGVPGGIIPRNLDGREYPVYGHIGVTGGTGGGTAAVSWDTFAGDVQKDGTIRLTMLRTPLYAHHPPFDEKSAPLFPVMDQGEHEYEVSVILGNNPGALITRERTRLKHPLIIRETTRGMGVRHEY